MGSKLPSWSDGRLTMFSARLMRRQKGQPEAETAAMTNIMTSKHNLSSSVLSGFKETVLFNPHHVKHQLNFAKDTVRKVNQLLLVRAGLKLKHIIPSHDLNFPSVTELMQNSRVQTRKELGERTSVSGLVLVSFYSRVFSQWLILPWTGHVFALWLRLALSSWSSFFSSKGWDYGYESLYFNNSFRMSMVVEATGWELFLMVCDQLFAVGIKTETRQSGTSCHQGHACALLRVTLIARSHFIAWFN